VSKYRSIASCALTLLVWREFAYGVADAAFIPKPYYLLPRLNPDRLPSKEMRERLCVDDSIDIAAEQVALVWACVVKR